MKKQKMVLAALLAAALIFSAVPPTAVARAADAACQVLAEYSWQGGTYADYYSTGAGDALDIFVGEDRSGTNTAQLRYDGGKIVPGTDSGILFSGPYYTYFKNGYYAVHSYGEDRQQIYDAQGRAVMDVPAGKFNFIPFEDTKYVLYGDPDCIVDLTARTMTPSKAVFNVMMDGISSEGLYPDSFATESLVDDRTVYRTAYRYVDDSGSIIIPGPFEDASLFVDGCAYVADDSGARFINASGATVKELDCDYCWGGDYYPVSHVIVVHDPVTGLYGLESPTSRLSPRFYDVQYLVNKHLVVEAADGTYGVTEQDGSTVVPTGTYDFINATFFDLEKEFFIGSTSAGKYVLMDAAGRTLYTSESGYTLSFTDIDAGGGPLICRTNRVTGARSYVDPTGKLLFGGKDVTFYPDGPAGDTGCWVVYDSGAYLVDENGSPVIPAGQFTSLIPRSDGLVWGFKHDYSSNKATASILKITGASSDTTAPDTTTPGTTTPGTTTPGTTTPGTTTPAPAAPAASSAGNIYDTYDPGTEVEALVSNGLEGIVTVEDICDSVYKLSYYMTDEQEASPNGINLAVLYAEAAAATLTNVTVMDNLVTVDPYRISMLADGLEASYETVTDALAEYGLTAPRPLARTVTFTTEETENVTVTLIPGLDELGIDKVRVETPSFALTFDTADMALESPDPLTFICTAVPGSSVSVQMPEGGLTSPVTLSFPVKGNAANQAVMDSSNAAVTSKYNPVTATVDGKVLRSGTYTLKSNARSFTDIGGKSREMQTAITYLASMGIVNGTGTGATFSPDGAITRAEIAALIVRALGKEDKTAAARFADVTPADWYYAAAASSQKWNIIKGDDAGRFRGGDPITKNEAVIVAARVLANEMGYTYPDYPASVVGVYKDAVEAWAQSEAALATKENLVLYRTDGTFAGGANMTRGDVAILIYRLFQKLW